MCVALAHGKQSNTPSKPPGLIGSVATAPITGIQILLHGANKLQKKILDSENKLVSKFFEALEKLLQKTGGLFDGKLDKLKCVVKQPLKFLECF